MKIPNSDITAVILAGGQARRMDGRDKALLPLRGKPMLAYICETIQPQVGRLLINSNRPPEDYRDFSLPVISDTLPGHLGPLAGLLTAFENSSTDYVLTVPCDTPLLPADLVQRLSSTLLEQQADIATVRENGRRHAAIMLARRSLIDNLRRYLDTGERRVQSWLEQQKLVEVDYSDHGAAFMNINTPAELAQFEQQGKAPHHAD